MQKHKKIKTTLLFGGWLLMLNNCSSPQARFQEGFEECKSKIDAQRQASRKMGHHSYRHDQYNECMKAHRLERELNDRRLPEIQKRLEADKPAS